MLIKEGKSSKKVKTYWKNTNLHHLKANLKQNHNVTLISSPLFNPMEDCMKWMALNNAQLITEIAHKNNFWQKAVK